MKSRVVGLGLLVCATACNRADRKPESTRSVEERVTSGPCAFTAPPTGGSVTNVTFAVKTPAGVLPSDLALGTALGSLKQQNGVKLVKDAGGFASVASVEASARLAIGTDAQAQSAYSELTGIDVGARAHLFGSVRTANTLTRGPNVLIDGTISQNSNLKPLEILAWNAAFPSLNRGSCDLQPDKTQIIDPGTYGNIVVKARSHLKLRAGTYYFTSLSLEATAILDVDNGAGPVFINVKNAFAWSGAVVETQPTKGNVVFALATNGPVNVMTALRGLVVAPNATLTLSTSTGHYGSFFARTLEVQPNATIHHRPLSSAAVCPGATDCNALCPCPPGGICRSDAECQSGLTCEPGTAGVEVCTPVNIDDGNPCTIDSFAGGSVVHTPVPAGTSCSDGNACNGAETCNASGSCVAGAPVVCVASDQCHDAGACAPATGLCENPEKPNGTACSDADACTASDTCQAGSCTSGAPVAIDDGNPCTTDACDPATGVIHAAVAAGTSCADGDACNGAETCSASANCLGGTPPVVDDGNPCTADACDPSSGVSHTAVAAGASCADGDACNGAETCNGAGSCAAGTPPVVDDGNPCTADACDSASGVAHTPLPGTSCETDGDVCNGVSVCDVTGACVAGPPPDFNDGNACTSDSCDPASGPVHTAVAAGSSCSNGDACDGDEACDGSGDCLPGTPLVLDDGDPCTRDVCDPLDGISHAPEPAGTSCEDGNLCTSDDACDAEGFCASGPPVLLEDDGDPCTLRYCHPETGVHTVTCPPVDAASVTTLDKSFEFLYTGPDAPQTGVEPGTIEPLRAAVVSGRVLDLAGTGISGAAVSVVGAPELGVSTTLPDGTFYLAVNGGESLVIDVAADGYLRAQRRVEPKWGGFDAAPEIALVGLDPEVTAIEVDAPVYQVARGSTSVDADGTRRATVMFPPGTTATMTLPDGSVVPLDDVEVRATEFTVGARGDEAMPGELPPSSGYTYAAELSVDAALVAGATRVDFNQDLPFYLENFLNIPNGTSVPAGYYDRELGQWVPSDNGRVIRIVSAFNGTANVDADGNGSPDTDAALSALGITVGERRELAARYSVGASLWRVPIRHFTPWDCNFPYGPDPGDCAPSEECGDSPDPTPPEPDPEPCTENGSIIECTNQTLRERFPVPGTPFTLDYSSDRVPGFTAQNTLRIPITGATPMPSTARRAELEISVAGRTFTQTFSTAPNQTYTFVWDGMDAFGRRLQGAQEVIVRRGYTYNAVYMRPAEFRQAFALPSGVQLTGNRARREITLSTVSSHFISGVDAAGAFELGGFSLSEHHVYDPRRRKLVRGDGAEEDPGFVVSNVIGRVAGTGSAGPGSEGVPATTSALSSPAGVAVARDGTLYVSDTANRRVRRVRADGTIETVAGSFVWPTTPNLIQNPGNELPIPAVNQIPFWTASAGVSWTAKTSNPAPFEGSAYFFAGNEQFAVLEQEVDLAPFTASIDAGQQGFAFECYTRSIAESQVDTTEIAVNYLDAAKLTTMPRFFVTGLRNPNGWFRVAEARIVPPGTRYVRVSLVARRPGFGANDGYFDGVSLRPFGTGDGAPSTQAFLTDPRGLAFGPDGSLYIADAAGQRVRRIDSDGIIHTVAGNGARGFSFSGDGGPATAAMLDGPTAVAVAPDGAVYVADTGNNRIRVVSSSGYISTLIGGIGGGSGNGDGGPANRARLTDPQGVAVAPDGSVLIADTGAHTIRRIGTDGIIRSIAGTGTSGATGDGGLAKLARLNRPSGLLAAADGRVFIADESNHRIRMITPAGRITTVAGIGTAGAAGDAGPATVAQLNGPDAVALAPNGAVLISERLGHRVRRLEQPLPELALGDISVPSAERELVYVFTGEGRHLRTLHALTGATLYEFDYDDTNRLQSIRDFDGNVTEIQRASNGQATAIVGPFGQRTELGYDENGYLNLIRDPLGREVALGLDGQGLLTSLRNQRGNDYSFQYDASGRLALDADPAGGFQTLTRLEDPSGASVTHTTALGRSTVYDLRTLATGGTRRTTTFPNGLQNTVTTLPDGSTSTSLPEGTSVQAFLTSDPRFGIAAPLRSTTTRTPAGLTRTSARSRSVVLSDPKNPFSVVSVVDTLTENSRVSSVRYDAATRTFTSTTAAGRTSTRMIDDKGRTITAQQSGLLPATFHYDAAGRLDSMTQGSRSTTLAFVPAGPSAGYLESITTGPSDRVTYTRDPLGRVLEETLGAVTTTLTRDALGNVTSVTPPGKPAHGMTYSSVDLLETYDPPQLALPSASTTYVYDVDRFLLGETRPGGDQILRTPDGAGRIDTIAIASGLVDHDYYPAGTASGAGQKSDVRGPYGVDLHFTYDGTLETSTTWSGDVVGSVAFSYNADFEHSLEVVNGGTGSAQVTFGYDADRLVSCASPTTCSPAGADALRIARHPQHGLVSGLTLGSTSETRGYNGFGELARQTATHGSATLVDITYDSAAVARDELGRVTQRTELIAGVTKVHGYTYDSQRRLTDVTVNGSLAEHFEYDANGNRTLAFLAAAGTTWTGGYDAQDRLASYGPFDFSYTANGELETKTNRETGEAWAFQYDALGNLLAVGLPDGTLIEYLVDGLGRRVGKKVGGTLVKQWLYRDGLRPAAELDANGALVSQFVYASTESVPDYVRRGGSTYRVISDELGSPVFVVNVADASDVPFRASYSSFGTVIGSGLDWMPFGFAGGIGDIHTGLVRFGARDYDPTLGRWTAKDPLRFDGKQVNLYAYVANDPVNGRDPTGRNPEACARQCSNDSVQWEEECRSKCYFDDILCNPDYDAYEDCVSACHTDTNQRTLKCWRECGAYFDSTCFGHSPEDMWCYT